jgi:hypothetical protein
MGKEKREVMTLDKTVDKPQGLLPGLNIKGISQGGRYSKEENKNKRFGQERKKSLPQKEKVSLSLRDRKGNKGQSGHSKKGSGKKKKGDALTDSVQPKQIDITI